MKEIRLEPPVEAELHRELRKELNVEAAARKLQIWTDKQRRKPIRRWEHCNQPTQKMFMLLAYDIILALGEEDDERDSGGSNCAIDSAGIACVYDDREGD